MDEIDAYRTAKILLDARGEKGAQSYATAQTIDLSMAGDDDGLVAWQRVLKAMHELTRELQEREVMH